MHTVERINVAPSSEQGHYVEKSKKVVNLNEINETFLVEGGGMLTTKNHTTLPMDEDCLITCQTVYNPFQKSFEKSKD